MNAFYEHHKDSIKFSYRCFDRILLHGCIQSFLDGSSRRRTALDKLGDRLLDVNRDIGKPDKLTVIFGRKITRFYRGKLQTEIEDMHLGNPVMRSCYRNGFAKHYVRDHDLLRFETASNNITKDYGINKGMENLPALRERLQGITERYQNVQQDILETFVDRGELRALAEPTVLHNGKRIPGLKLDHARQLALMHACSISRATWSGSSTRKVFILKA